MNIEFNSPMMFSFSYKRGIFPRSLSPIRDRVRDDNRNRRKRRSTSRERGRRIETIVQSSAIVSPRNPSVVDPDMLLADGSDVASNASLFRYANENHPGSEYNYYPRNNLTYPPRIDEATGSPKRLSLDDR